MAQGLKATGKQADALANMYARIRAQQGLGSATHTINDAIREEKERQREKIVRTHGRSKK